jgi:long-subunit acyl-CoA synthetase (AMP-forming)
MLVDDGQPAVSDDCFTVLFTSGSSGTPKAVAIGVDAFVRDIAGGKVTDSRGAAESITVSYIPLSHSSDRYKVSGRWFVCLCVCVCVTIAMKKIVCLVWGVAV